MPLEMIPYKDKGVFRLKSVDSIIQTLDDHQVQLSSMKATRYIAFAKLIFAFTLLTMPN